MKGGGEKEEREGGGDVSAAMVYEERMKLVEVGVGCESHLSLLVEEAWGVGGEEWGGV